MDFQLADEHRMVQATVREFARQEILPRAAALDHTPVFPSEIIQKAAALGLRGTKAFVTNAVEADVCIVYARTGPEPGARGISAFIVEKGFPGISVGKVEKKLGIKCSSTAEIVLDGCRVPASNLLGEPGSGGKIALTTLDGGRLGIAATSVGIARAALEEATAYAAGRRQFGRSIGEFQAIQWMLADMATRTDAARLLMLRAAYLRQQGTRYTREASMAKLFASEPAMWVTQKAVQIFGGEG